MTEAIYYQDSAGRLFEQVPEQVEGAFTHIELGGSGVFWREVDLCADLRRELEEVQQENQRLREAAQELGGGRGAIEPPPRSPASQPTKARCPTCNSPAPGVRPKRVIGAKVERCPDDFHNQ